MHKKVREKEVEGRKEVIRKGRKNGTGKNKIQGGSHKKWKKGIAGRGDNFIKY